MAMATWWMKEQWTLSGIGEAADSCVAMTTMGRAAFREEWLAVCALIPTIMMMFLTYITHRFVCQVDLLLVARAAQE